MQYSPQVASTAYVPCDLPELESADSLPTRTRETNGMGSTDYVSLSIGYPTCLKHTSPVYYYVDSLTTELHVGLYSDEYYHLHDHHRGAATVGVTSAAPVVDMTRTLGW